MMSGTLIASIGTLIKTIGTLTATIGTLTATIGTLIKTIGTLIATIGTPYCDYRYPLLRLSVPLLRLSVPLLRLSLPLLRLSVPLLRPSVPLLRLSAHPDGLDGRAPAALDPVAPHVAPVDLHWVTLLYAVRPKVQEGWRRVPGRIVRHRSRAIFRSKSLYRRWYGYRLAQQARERALWAAPDVWARVGMSQGFDRSGPCAPPRYAASGLPAHLHRELELREQRGGALAAEQRRRRADDRQETCAAAAVQCSPARVRRLCLLSRPPPGAALQRAASHRGAARCNMWRRVATRGGA
jgi:hypothetical protein